MTQTNPKYFETLAGNFVPTYTTRQAASDALVADLATIEETLNEYTEFTVAEYTDQDNKIYFYASVGCNDQGTHTDRSGFDDFIANRDDMFSEFKTYDITDSRSKSEVEAIYAYVDEE